MNPPPTGFVAIYELTREWTTYRWLCEACLAAAKAEGWTTKYYAPCNQACDRCPDVPSKFLKPDGSVDAEPTRDGIWRGPGPNYRRPARLKPWPKPKGWKPHTRTTHAKAA